MRTREAGHRAFIVPFRQLPPWQRPAISMAHDAVQYHRSQAIMAYFQQVEQAG
jgi:hypothetical protein